MNSKNQRLLVILEEFRYFLVSTFLTNFSLVKFSFVFFKFYLWNYARGVDGCGIFQEFWLEFLKALGFAYSVVPMKRTGLLNYFEVFAPPCSLFSYNNETIGSLTRENLRQCTV